MVSSFKQRTNLKEISFASLFFVSVEQTKNHFFVLCLFFLSLFFRLCVDILCLFFFFPLGIASTFYWVNTLIYLLFFNCNR